MNHFLTLMDCTPEEIVNLLDVADQLKYEKKNGIEDLKKAQWYMNKLVEVSE